DCSARDPCDVLGSRALFTLHQVELHQFTLGERLEPGALDGGVVDEAIAISVRWGDEAKALGVVEPLHRSGGPHEVLLCDDGTGLHVLDVAAGYSWAIRCPPRWARSRKADDLRWYGPAGATDRGSGACDDGGTYEDCVATFPSYPPARPYRRKATRRLGKPRVSRGFAVNVNATSRSVKPLLLTK